MQKVDRFKQNLISATFFYNEKQLIGFIGKVGKKIDV